MLLGEVNLPPDQQREFFGDEDGDELHVLFAFTVNQAMFLALAREDAGAAGEGARRSCRRSPPTASGRASSATTTS